MEEAEGHLVFLDGPSGRLCSTRRCRSWGCGHPGGTGDHSWLLRSQDFRERSSRWAAGEQQRPGTASSGPRSGHSQRVDTSLGTAPSDLTWLLPPGGGGGPAAHGQRCPAVTGKDSRAPAPSVYHCGLSTPQGPLEAATGSCPSHDFPQDRVGRSPGHCATGLCSGLNPPRKGEA